MLFHGLTFFCSNSYPWFELKVYRIAFKIIISTDVPKQNKRYTILISIEVIFNYLIREKHLVQSSRHTSRHTFELYTYQRFFKNMEEYERAIRTRAIRPMLWAKTPQFWASQQHKYHHNNSDTKNAQKHVNEIFKEIRYDQE